MAQATAVAPVKHQFDDPRPGRSTCTSVSTYDCLAPAGYRVGSGFASAPGVRRSDLHTCGYCGEPVCNNCKTDFADAGVACDSHSEDELLDWLRWATPTAPATDGSQP